MLAFVGGFIGMLVGELIYDYFNGEFNFKGFYYGSCGYWLAVLVWAFN